jgi:hypothetical protein
MLDLNYAPEMARLQHQDRLRKAEEAWRYQELKMGQVAWLQWLRNHLSQNR